jgi:Predicted transcriptional regulator
MCKGWYLIVILWILFLVLHLLFILTDSKTINMDQPKLERLLRLMKMLTANNSQTVDEIAKKLGISSRSVYRYIDTFREAGFVIKKTGNFIKLDKSSPYFKDISQLIHFTEEEAYILKSAIESIDENNLLKQNLKKSFIPFTTIIFWPKRLLVVKTAATYSNLFAAWKIKSG